MRFQVTSNGGINQIYANSLFPGSIPILNLGTGVLSGTLTTVLFDVQVNSVDPLGCNLLAEASTYLTTGSATVEFGNTFSFATNGPVFDLPAGVTVNGGGIVNNIFGSPVPLPGTLPLLGSGLLGLAAFRLRRKK